MATLKKKIVVLSIVTYNSKHIFTILDNLKKEFLNSSFLRIMIFDNCSDKAYQEKLSKYADFVELHFHDKNEGFGFGHNYNLLNAEEPFFLIFNPDVIMNRISLENMLMLIQDNPQAGLVVPKVLNSDGTTQYLIRNKVSVFDYALRFIPIKLIKQFFDNRLAIYECRQLPDDTISKVRIGSGCCMLLRGNAFKEIHGFDNQYFMYFEDYDLCLELEKRNYEVLYTPFVEITHFYEKGAHKNFKLFKIFMQSMRKFFNKWGWRFF